MTQSELFKIAKKMRRDNRVFVPIPADPNRKRPVGLWAGNSYKFEKDFQQREQLLGNTANLGLLVSDAYVVIDVDNKAPAVRGSKQIYSESTGLQDFITLVNKHGEFPDTMTVTTPSGGKHYYFSVADTDDEKKLKNWSCCMNLDGRLIAVDIRKKGGYVMCPPSMKGTKRYRWESSEEHKATMATLPSWIVTNIMETMTKAPIHFEKQEFTCEPSLNEDFKDEDLDLFKTSPYWQDCFQAAKSPDVHNRIVFTATGPYDCDICSRRHINNSNHPFLVRHNGVLRFICRSGKGFNAIIDIDWKQKYEDFDSTYKKFVDIGDRTDRAVSELFAAEINGKLVPTASQDIWLIFDPKQNIWRSEHRDVATRPYADKFVKVFKDLERICQEASTPEQEHVWKERIDTCKALHYYLSTYTKKKNGMLSLYEKIRDSCLDEKFDKKQNLLVCSNGVFDLDLNEFRDAIPEDYCTLSTQQPYLPYNEHPKEKRDLVERFFDDMTLGNKDLEHYLKKILASSLHGKVTDQLWYIFVGKGANCKSTVISLMKKALGMYYAPISSAQIASAHTSSQSATPALFALLHKRAAFLTEYEQEVLHTEFIKMLAGGDETSGRDLYKPQMRMPLEAKLFAAVNKLPTVKDKTDGFWRKMVVVPFLAKMVQNPTAQHERLLDDTFEQRISQCADTFLAMLIQVYTTSYKAEGVRRNVQPKIVQDATLNYQLDQNVQLSFYQACCKDDVSEFETITNIGDAFKTYLSRRCIDKTKAHIDDLYTFMDDKFPPTNKGRQMRVCGQNKRGWKGVKLLKETEVEGIHDEDQSDGDE